MLKDIEKIIPEVDNSESFSSWDYLAHDKLVWSILINNIGSNNFKPTPDWDGKIPDSPKSPFTSTYSEKQTPRTPPQFPSSPPIPSPPPLPLSPLPPPSFQTYSPRLKILFRILNLNPTSILREVRRSYYLLARKYHPDKWNEEISKISKAESAERFKSISNAFEDLKMANCLV